MRGLLLAASAAAALAACPNSCSGFGTCTTNDVCSCYAGRTGADCSLRICASGNSWALDSAADPHGYEECSGAGVCDRTSGTCKCFGGYTGNACQRRSCPHDCSGNGVCKPLKEIANDVPLSAGAWEGDKIMACQCDTGFFGADCSQRRCPSGDDPLTICSSTRKEQVQEIKVTLGSCLTSGTCPEGMAFAGTSDSVTQAAATSSSTWGQLFLGYTDVYGQVYPSVTAAKAVFGPDAAGRSDGRDSVQVALEAIPNDKVHGVRVAVANVPGAPADLLARRYLVTFISEPGHEGPVGLQRPLAASFSCADLDSCTNSWGGGSGFLYRYASTPEMPDFDVATRLPGTTFAFFAGPSAAFTGTQFVRLSAGARPRMPLGKKPAAGYSASSTGNSFYDIRVVVAVQDPKDSFQVPSTEDVFWVKVVYENANIAADRFEYDQAAGARAGAWSSARAASFSGTLLGFQYHGPIPSSRKVVLPDFPGLELEFPSTDMVTDNGKFRFFELLVKLPTVEVTALVKGNEFTAADGTSALAPVDPNVENVECSNRGQCNRATGECECYNGYTGLTCGTMTTLV